MIPISSWADADRAAREALALAGLIEQAKQAAQRRIETIRTELEEHLRPHHAELDELEAAVRGWVLAHLDEFPAGSRSRQCTLVRFHVRQSPASLALASARKTWDDVLELLAARDRQARLRSFEPGLAGLLHSRAQLSLAAAGRTARLWPKLLDAWESERSLYSPMIRLSQSLDRAAIKAAHPHPVGPIELKALGLKITSLDLVSWEPVSAEVGQPSDHTCEPAAAPSSAA